MKRFKSPKKIISPLLTFTALIPVRHEEVVIRDTILAVSNMVYPEHMKEIIVICSDDDKGTIHKVNDVIKEIGKRNISLHIYSEPPINKPHALNYALQYAKNDVIAVFDAEDEPHKKLYEIINTVMIQKKSDVVQSGVQLMNYKSNWFSVFNVLEYYFWFKSSLPFFANQGVIPLGGNTIFFKRETLKKVGGWDPKCLAEDADIGIRLSQIGAKINVIYDEEHATREETPPDLQQFIKQRTRWIQGFIQVLNKKEWKKLPSFTHKILALYILTISRAQALFLVYIPFSIFMIIMVKIPLTIALISILPLYILIIQIAIYNIGLYEFTTQYKIKYSIFVPLNIVLTFFPYQVILSYCAMRAIFRNLKKNNSWEKTKHTNAHRQHEIDEMNIPLSELQK